MANAAEPAGEAAQAGRGGASAGAGTRPGGRRAGRWSVEATLVLLLGASGAGLVLSRPSPTLTTRVLVALVTTAVLVAVLITARRRGATRTAGWIALLTGVVGMTGTGALAGDALSRGNLWREVAVAGVGLMAGLVLVWSGGRTLLRRERRGSGWLVVPARALLGTVVVVVLAQFVVLPVLAGVMASARLPIEPTGRDPGDAALSYQDLTLTTSDGVDLAAWYVPSQNGAAVVLLHGAGSTRASTLPHAEVLAGCGFGVLLLDARGHGDSAGLPMELGWYGTEDVTAAIDALAAQPDVAAIGLLGLSMGGEAALTAAAGDERVRVVVAEGVGRRTAADALATRTGWHGWLEWTVTALDMGVADALSAAHPPVPLRDTVGAIAPRPVLLIAGSGEAEQVGWYRDAAPASVQVVSLPEVPHTGALSADPAGWRTMVCDELDDALLPAVAAAGR
ncbi:alpha/beta fold hydrolase [Actinotalea sp. M2MS4P-6]|uniref:alpha/beta hydrolase n=1 Tax=Actinotalea sp. M2MS4P-6 TaxID=2983762 RepID=UPI0021E4991C|nr:alpha/beta fold hydrolase [Actinotalea sp. M2MS4P-6]MCV2393651.1 alpha/beta fold hydrolase [Actinotalea sp. M2MS4P-6]